MLRGPGLWPLVGGHHPDAFQRQGKPDLLGKLGVVGEELFQQLLAAPEAHPEKVPRQLLLDIGLEASPAHEQAGFGTELLACADQLVDRGPIHWIRA